jgi:hypothetical protein
MDLQNAILKVLAGGTRQDMYDKAAMGETPVAVDPEHPDRALHAATAQEMTKRIGGGPTRALGVSKEVLQGLAALFAGNYSGAIGEGGFDPADLEANELGIAAGEAPVPAPPAQFADPRTGRANAPEELDPAIVAFLRSRGKPQ